MPRKFLVVADDSAEFQAALRYAARRAKSTGGRVALLKVLTPSNNDYFAGVREEIEAQLRQEGEEEQGRLRIQNGHHQTLREDPRRTYGGHLDNLPDLRSCQQDPNAEINQVGSTGVLDHAEGGGRCQQDG